jgi:hypothetical protein
MSVDEMAVDEIIFLKVSQIVDLFVFLLHRIVS